MNGWLDISAGIDYYEDVLNLKDKNKEIIHEKNNRAVYYCSAGILYRYLIFSLYKRASASHAAGGDDASSANASYG